MAAIANVNGLISVMWRLCGLAAAIRLAWLGNLKPANGVAICNEARNDG